MLIILALLIVSYAYYVLKTRILSDIMTVKKQIDNQHSSILDTWG